jgi:hypothetical protein
VSVRWKQTDGSFKLDVEIPAGSTATITIPEKCDKYIINGKSRRAGGHTAEVESGKYSLSF